MNPTLMNPTLKNTLPNLAIFGLVMMTSVAPVSANDAESELSGLWEARRIFGPEDNGAMMIRQSENGLWADFGGAHVAVMADEALISFYLPGGGRFEGVLEYKLPLVLFW